MPLDGRLQGREIFFAPENGGTGPPGCRALTVNNLSSQEYSLLFARHSTRDLSQGISPTFLL